MPIENEIIDSAQIRDRRRLQNRLSQRKRRAALEGGVLNIHQELIETYHHVSSRVRKVFFIQFWAWMAWFPFLFYGSNYVSEIYRTWTLKEFHNETGVHSTQNFDTTALSAEGSRLGSLAYFLFSVVALVSNLLFALTLTRRRDSIAGGRLTLLAACQIPWLGTHLIYTICMLFTFFANSWTMAILLVAYPGVSWAMTQWVPYAIIGEELATSSDESYEVPVAVGTVIALHNVVICVPQVFAAVISSVILLISEAVGCQDGTAWILRSSAFAALGAAYLTVTAAT